MKLYNYLRVKIAADTAEKTIDQYQADDISDSIKQNGTQSKSYYYNAKDDPTNKIPDNKISWKKRLAATGIGAALGTGAAYSWYKGMNRMVDDYLPTDSDPYNPRPGEFGSWEFDAVHDMDPSYVPSMLPLSALYGTVGYRLARRLGLGRKGKAISAGVGTVLPHALMALMAYDTKNKIPKPISNTVAGASALANLGAPLAGAWLANDFLKG